MTRFEKKLSEYRIRHTPLRQASKLQPFFFLTADIMISHPGKYKRICLLTEFSESIKSPSINRNPLTVLILSGLNHSLEPIIFTVGLWDERRERDRPKVYKGFLEYFK